MYLSTIAQVEQFLIATYLVFDFNEIELMDVLDTALYIYQKKTFGAETKNRVGTDETANQAQLPEKISSFDVKTDRS